MLLDIADITEINWQHWTSMGGGDCQGNAEDVSNTYPNLQWRTPHSTTRVGHEQEPKPPGPVNNSKWTMKMSWLFLFILRMDWGFLLLESYVHTGGGKKWLDLKIPKEGVSIYLSGNRKTHISPYFLNLLGKINCLYHPPPLAKIRELKKFENS